jgi:hypothetical protein
MNNRIYRIVPVDILSTDTTEEITDRTDTTEESIISDENSEMDDYSINTENENECELIYDSELRHRFEELENNNYYIGVYYKLKLENVNLIANTVSARTFLSNSYVNILHYLWLYSILRISKPKIEIMKLVILEDGTYSVILKTFWLRLFQRRWKSRFEKRKEIINERKKITSILYREVFGRYPLGLNVLP